MHSGRLVGHNGAVCALTMKGSLMITGSRDRLIKVHITLLHTIANYKWFTDVLLSAL